jgi:hypothetical protein
MSNAGPLPFAITSTVHPTPSTPALAFVSGTTTWSLTYFAAAPAEADAPPVAAATPDAVAPGEPDALGVAALHAARRRIASGVTSSLFMTRATAIAVPSMAAAYDA